MKKQFILYFFTFLLFLFGNDTQMSSVRAASNAPVDAKQLETPFSKPFGFENKKILKMLKKIKGEGARFATGLIIALIGVAMVLVGLSSYSMALFYGGLIMIILGGGILGVGLWFNI